MRDQRQTDRQTDGRIHRRRLKPRPYFKGHKHDPAGVVYERVVT